MPEQKQQTGESGAQPQDEGQALKELGNVEKMINELDAQVSAGEVDFSQADANTRALARATARIGAAVVENRAQLARVQDKLSELEGKIS